LVLELGKTFNEWCYFSNS